jgi:hypothetical protein
MQLDKHCRICLSSGTVDDCINKKICTKSYMTSLHGKNNVKDYKTYHDMYQVRKYTHSVTILVPSLNLV